MSDTPEQHYRQHAERKRPDKDPGFRLASTPENSKVPRLCRGCGEPLVIENLFSCDGCPCNSPNGTNFKPQSCDSCRTDNCTRPGCRLRDLFGVGKSSTLERERDDLRSQLADVGRENERLREGLDRAEAALARAVDELAAARKHEESWREALEKTLGGDPMHPYTLDALAVMLDDRVRQMEAALARAVEKVRELEAENGRLTLQHARGQVRPLGDWLEPTLEQQALCGEVFDLGRYVEDLEQRFAASQAELRAQMEANTRAVEAEREACARLCDDLMCAGLAEEIRARGGK